MDNDEFSRRSFLRAVAGTLGVSWIPLNWSEIANAAHHAHEAAQAPAVSRVSFLTDSEAADVEAVAAQIIPSDATPGAREAGVVYFVDRALATFLSRLAESFRAQLAEFRAGMAARHPDAQSFAALSLEAQAESLKAIEHTPFFERMRQLTVFGMFAMPTYGGNRDGVGWKLLGFEDQHVFEPPFGYYDRDYPGFAAEPVTRP